VINLNTTKLHAIDPDADASTLQENLSAFARIAGGDKSAGPIAQLELTERFRWLTAVRSSCIQTSRPHPGLSADLEKTLQRLMSELVF